MNGSSPPPPPLPPPSPSTQQAPPSVAAMTALPAAAAPRRDRIVVIGRRRAGKTIYLARLYEALWQGCRLVDGRMLGADESPNGRRVVEMSCRATSGAAHTQFMKVIEELRAGRWPAATVGNSYAELIVTYGGRERVLTALDYPGEVFRKAFMNDSDDPDALELLAAIDRAAAAIFLIDPAVVAAGGTESHEDTFGLTQAAARIRSGVDGATVPIAVVLTKTDANKALLREAGGVREFAHRHFGQMFKSLERTSVFASAAVRVTENALGKPMPRAEKPAENVVEPLRYCFEMMQASAAVSLAREAQRMSAEVAAALAQTEVDEERESTRSWTVFIIAMVMLFGLVGVVTWLALSQK
ncbi:MAG: TRAFAC clade GTPase domain-containing protein [bacterium]